MQIFSWKKTLNNTDQEI